MNASRKQDGSKRTTNRSLRVSPTTRAIRAALAASATMLALAGSGMAFAGTCTPAAPGGTVTCSGDFVTPINYAVDDLTVIMDVGSTVTTAGVDSVNLTDATTGYSTLSTTATSPPRRTPQA